LSWRANETKAMEIATKFLEQYHSNVLPKNVILEDNTYMVTLVTGLVEKKTVQVRIDATAAHIVGFTYPVDFEKIIDNVLELGNEIRYVLVVDSKGRYIHSKMSSGKTILVKKEDQITNLSTDLHVLRQLLRIFDESLGKTTFAHFEREKIHILIFYIRDLIFCVTCERSLEDQKIIDISKKIRITIEGHINKAL